MPREVAAQPVHSPLIRPADVCRFGKRSPNNLRRIVPRRANFEQLKCLLADRKLEIDLRAQVRRWPARGKKRFGRFFNAFVFEGGKGHVISYRLNDERSIRDRVHLKKTRIQS